MMKQVTILCSEEIQPLVQNTLIRKYSQAYAEFGDVTGNRPKDPRYIDSRNLSWPACVYMLMAEEDIARQIVADLREYASSCDVQPCLRVMAVPVEDYA